MAITGKSSLLRAKLLTFAKHAGIALLLLLTLKYAMPDGTPAPITIAESSGTRAEVGWDEASLSRSNSIAGLFSRGVAPGKPLAHQVSAKMMQSTRTERESKAPSAMVVKTADLALIA